LLAQLEALQPTLGNEPLNLPTLAAKEGRSFVNRSVPPKVSIWATVMRGYVRPDAALRNVRTDRCG